LATSETEHRTPHTADRSPAPIREITVIVVSWNDAEDVRSCITSLAEARRRIPAQGLRVSLVVVNNGSGVPDCEVLSLWPDATVLVNETNRGFGPAANQAADVAKGDALLFVNPDTRAEGDPFSELARGFDAHPEAAALAPRLLDWNEPESKIDNLKSRIPPRLSPPDREDQFTFQLRRLPGFASDARALLLVDHLAPNNPGRRRCRYADLDRTSPFEVEQAAAAALAVRRGVFLGIGGFDARFVPAWFEDVDLCARLSAQGKTFYWPAARFRHLGGLSSETLGYARFLPVYYRNALLYRHLHYGFAGRLLYRPLLIAGMLLRLAALPFRPGVPRSRRESARAYLATLAVALGLSGIHNSQFSIHNFP
jgi:GT2 family glycosyltransferase